MTSRELDFSPAPQWGMRLGDCTLQRHLDTLELELEGGVTAPVWMWVGSRGGVSMPLLLWAKGGSISARVPQLAHLTPQGVTLPFATWGESIEGAGYEGVALGTGAPVGPFCDLTPDEKSSLDGESWRQFAQGLPPLLLPLGHALPDLSRVWVLQGKPLWLPVTALERGPSTARDSSRWASELTHNLPLPPSGAFLPPPPAQGVKFHGRTWLLMGVVLCALLVAVFYGLRELGIGMRQSLEDQQALSKPETPLPEIPVEDKEDDEEETQIVSYLPVSTVLWDEKGRDPTAHDLLEQAHQSCLKNKSAKDCAAWTFGTEVYLGRVSEAVKYAQESCALGKDLCCPDAYYKADAGANWGPAVQMCQAACNKSKGNEVCQYAIWSEFQSGHKEHAIQLAQESCQSDPVQESLSCWSWNTIDTETVDRKEFWNALKKGCDNGGNKIVCTDLLQDLRPSLHGDNAERVEKNLQQLANWGHRYAYYLLKSSDNADDDDSDDAFDEEARDCIQNRYGVTCRRQAQLQWDAGHPEVAAHLARVACQEHLACELLGDIEASWGHLLEARTLWARACNQGFGSGCRQLGNAYQAEGKLDLAKAPWEKGCLTGDTLLCDTWIKSFRPASPSILQTLDEVCRDVGKNAKAPVSCHVLALEKDRQGLMAEAITLEQKSCDEGYGEACDTLGDMHQKAGRHEAARESWKKVCRGYTSDSPEACWKSHIGANTEDKNMYLERGCDVRHGKSCLELAKIRLEAQEIEEGERLLLESCNQGEGEGCRLIALRKKQAGKEEEYGELIQKACDLGNQESCLPGQP